MKKDTVDLQLPPQQQEEIGREYHMSLELYQNARQTMGELRDFMRNSGLSWDFIQSQIDASQAPQSPIDKTLARMDDYSTGPANSLDDLPSNVW